MGKEMLKCGDLVTFNHGLFAGIFLGFKCKVNFLINYYSKSFDVFRSRVHDDCIFYVIKLPLRMTGLDYLKDVEFNYVKEVLNAFVQNGFPYMDCVEVDAELYKLPIKNINTEVVKAALFNDSLSGVLANTIDDTDLEPKLKDLQNRVKTISISSEPVVNFEEGRLYVRATHMNDKFTIVVYHGKIFYVVRDYTHIDILKADLYALSRFTLNMLLKTHHGRDIMDNDFLYYETNVVMKEC